MEIAVRHGLKCRSLILFSGNMKQYAKLNSKHAILSFHFKQCYKITYLSPGNYFGSVQAAVRQLGTEAGDGCCLSRGRSHSCLCSILLCRRRCCLWSLTTHAREGFSHQCFRLLCLSGRCCLLHLHLMLMMPRARPQKGRATPHSRVSGRLPHVQVL